VAKGDEAFPFPFGVTFFALWDLPIDEVSGVLTGLMGSGDDAAAPGPSKSSIPNSIDQYEDENTVRTSMATAERKCGRYYARRIASLLFLDTWCKKSEDRRMSTQLNSENCIRAPHYANFQG
jgi:hypothetical protein